MFKLKNIFLFYFILIIFLSSCSKNKKVEIKKPEKIPAVNILYQEAIKNFDNNDWKFSIELFKKIETYYSFTDYAPRAKLMIMYINYENNNYYEVLEYASRFKKLYPKNRNIAYVDFLMGMCFYEQINISSRDQTYTNVALKIFKKIQKEYPNSIYAEDVKFKIDLLNEQLAGKEMYIARFYMKKSKWISAIKRLKIIINNYDTTIYITEALHRLVEIYYRIGNYDEAKKYAAILGYNFNDSDWYKKSYKIVGNKDYTAIKNKQKLKLREKLKKLLKLRND